MIFRCVPWNLLWGKSVGGIPPLPQESFRTAHRCFARHTTCFSAPSVTASPLVSVSVVIPTCGRPELLARCLVALKRQILGAEHFEVIVVDDGPTRHGPAVARNLGWRKARAPIVAFTDADPKPARERLEHGRGAFPAELAAVTVL